jgi:DNA (cytosine-5)-methyltransferase 1
MSKGVYYNELDKHKVMWLRHLIEESAIAKGIVDDRPIQSVQPDDLKGFDQHHFFAGIGVWSYALRRTGWPDDEPIWTGSCPCGPFSVAGLQKGFDDPRHLWPEWFRLIGECRPDRILGEQVAAAGAWIDLVQSDLEGHGYAFGSPDLPAAGFGGAHIRQRFMWVADADNAQWWAEQSPWHDGHWPATGRVEGYGHLGQCGPDGWLAYADGGHTGAEGLQRSGQHGQQQQTNYPISGLDDAYEAGRRPDAEVFTGWKPLAVPSSIGRLGNNNNTGPQVGSLRPDERGAIRLQGPAVGAPGLLHGCDWLFCTDGVWRPVEPGTFPLAPTSPGRVGLLRGYGDAIDAETLTEFIGAYMDCCTDAFLS